MATISPSGNDPNDGDRNPEEQKHIGPIPDDVKETLKKKRRLTDLCKDPHSVREYADIIRNMIKEQQDAERQRDEETAHEKAKEANLSKMKKVLQGLLRMMQVRTDVLSSITTILNFIDSEEEDFKGVPVAELRVRLVKLQEYVEKKNEEADAHQKKITDFFKAEQ